MLIQITNRCHMGSSHCMQDATPKGRHMTDETFDQVMDFCIEAKPMVAHVSDGATEAFRKMRASRPCGGCQLYKNFERRFPKEMKMLKK